MSAVGAAEPLRIWLDAGNELSKLIAERVVVNARAAGVTLQIVSRAAGRAMSDGGTAKPDGEAQLMAWRVTSLSARAHLQRPGTELPAGIPDGRAPSEAHTRLCC